MPLTFEFDLSKSKKNAQERALPFEMVEFFEFDTAVLVEDARKDYKETRMLAYGYIAERLHVLCFKPVTKHHIRIISLRKANRRELKKYEEEQNKEAHTTH